MNQSLYFIAILPDEKLRNRIRELKEKIRDEYHTSHALKSPAHITLQRPFKRQNSFEKELILKLEKFSAKQSEFKVLLKGFGAFSPRVLFLNIINHRPFEQVYKELKQCLKSELCFDEKELSSGIYPHITVAHRDLPPPVYHIVWAHFKEKTFEAEFVANSLCLLKHNGSTWDVYREFPLGKVSRKER